MNPIFPSFLGKNDGKQMDLGPSARSGTEGSVRASHLGFTPDSPKALCRDKSIIYQSAVGGRVQ